MKKILITAALALAAGCSEHPPVTQPAQSQAVGMANPASVYCEKQGGKLEIVKERAGETGYCTLPSGERLEEWTLFRRDNSK